MAYREHPEYVTEDSQRCEAMAKALPTSYFIWQRVERRCVRRVNQMRDGHAVCFQHAQTKDIKYWNTNS